MIRRYHSTSVLWIWLVTDSVSMFLGSFFLLYPCILHRTLLILAVPYLTVDRRVFGMSPGEFHDCHDLTMFCHAARDRCLTAILGAYPEHFE